MIDLKVIRNIILDLGGVILELDVERSIRGLKELGFPGLEELDIIFSKYPFFLAFETGRITTDQFFHQVLVELVARYFLLRQVPTKYLPILNLYAPTEGIVPVGLESCAFNVEVSHQFFERRIIGLLLLEAGVMSEI